MDLFPYYISPKISFNANPSKLNKKNIDQSETTAKINFLTRKHVLMH